MGPRFGHDFLSNRQELISNISSCAMLDSTMRAKTWSRCPIKVPQKQLKEMKNQLNINKLRGRPLGFVNVGCWWWILAAKGADGHGSRGGKAHFTFSPPPRCMTWEMQSGGLKKPYSALLWSRCEESRDQAGEEIQETGTNDCAIIP